MGFNFTDPDIYSLYDQRSSLEQPERKLLVAMLERAILDYVGNDSKQVQAAEDWLFSGENQGNEAYSFNWICEQLDLDSGRTTEIIKAMPKRGTSRVAPWYMKPTPQRSEAAAEAS